MKDSAPSKYDICVMHPNFKSYSETFIKAHINYLPANVHELYGGFWLPAFVKKNNKRYIKQWRKYLDDFLSVLNKRNIRYFEENALTRFLKKNRIRAVLAEYGPTGVAVLNSCIKAKTPLIVHFHGFDAYRNDVLIKEDYITKYKRLFEQASAFVVVSKDMHEQLLKIGAPAEKVNINSCGVDVNEFKPINPAKNPPVFITVGRFVKKKAPYLTILAFKETLKQIPDAILIMIGEGELYDVCKRLVNSLELEKNIQLVGAIDHSHVNDTLEKARAFVLHSIQPDDNDSEGTPVSVLEASARGLPVISTRHAGIKEAVDETVTGYLVDEGDIFQMSEYMIKLARNPEIAAKMGKAGRKKILKEYGMERQINNLWEVISKQIL